MEQYGQQESRRSTPSLWDKIWRDDEGHGEVVIFQWPNIWLIAWAAVNFVSVVSPTRGLAKITWWIGFVLIVIWSVLEIKSGPNYFRRGFGLFVLLIAVLAAIRGGF